MNTMFKLYHHHKLGSSYTPNLSASTRIAKFDRRVLEILPKEIPKEISQQDILVNQLNAICNQNFTYNFTSKLIKNESEKKRYTQYDGTLENIKTTGKTWKERKDF